MSELEELQRKYDWFKSDVAGQLGYIESSDTLFKYGDTNVEGWVAGLQKHADRIKEKYYPEEPTP